MVLILIFRAELSPLCDEPEAQHGSVNQTASISNDLVYQKFAVCSMQSKTKASEATTIVEHDQSLQPLVAVTVDDRDRDQYATRRSSRLSRRKQVEASTAASVLEVETNAESLLMQTMTVVKHEHILQPLVAVAVDDRERHQYATRSSSRLSHRKQVEVNTAASVSEVETNDESQLMQADTETSHSVDKELASKPGQRSRRTRRLQKMLITQAEKSADEDRTHTSATEKSPIGEKLMEPKLKQRKLRQKKQTEKSVSQKANAFIPKPDTNLNLSSFQQAVEAQLSAFEVPQDEDKQLKPKSTQRSLRARRQLKKPTEKSVDTQLRIKPYTSSPEQDELGNNPLFCQADKTCEPATIDNRASSQTTDISNQLFDNREDGKSESICQEETDKTTAFRLPQKNHSTGTRSCNVDTDSTSFGLSSGVMTNGHTEILHASNVGFSCSNTVMTEPAISDTRTVQAKQRVDRVKVSVGVYIKSHEDSSSLHKYPGADLCMHENIDHHEIANQNSSVIASQGFSHICRPLLDNSQHSHMHSNAHILNKVSAGSARVQGVSGIMSTLNERTYEGEDPMADHNESSQSVASQQPRLKKSSVVVSKYTGCFPPSASSQNATNVQQTQRHIVQKMPEAIGYTSPEMNEIPSSLSNINSQIQPSCELQNQAAFSRRKHHITDHSESSQTVTPQQQHRQKCSVTASDYSIGLQVAQQFNETLQQVSAAGVDYSSPEMNEISSSLPDLHSQMHDSDDLQKQAACAMKEDPVIDHSESSQTVAPQQRHLHKCSFAASDYSLGAQAIQTLQETQWQVSAAGIEYTSPEVNEIPSSLPVALFRTRQAVDTVGAAGTAETQLTLPDVDSDRNLFEFMFPCQGLHITDTNQSSRVAGGSDRICISDIVDSKTRDGGADMNVSHGNIQRRIKISEPVRSIWMHPSERHADAYDEVEDGNETDCSASSADCM